MGFSKRWEGFRNITIPKDPIHAYDYIQRKLGQDKGGLHYSPLWGVGKDALSASVEIHCACIGVLATMCNFMALRSGSRIIP